MQHLLPGPLPPLLDPPCSVLSCCSRDFCKVQTCCVFLCSDFPVASECSQDKDENFQLGLCNLSLSFIQHSFLPPLSLCFDPAPLASFQPLGIPPVVPWPALPSSPASHPVSLLSSQLPGMSSLVFPGTIAWVKSTHMVLGQSEYLSSPPSISSRGVMLAPRVGPFGEPPSPHLDQWFSARGGLIFSAPS